MSLRVGNQTGGFTALLVDAQTVTVSSSDSFGSGVLAAQSATNVGSGTRTVVDVGTFVDVYAQDATVVGTGPRIITGIGTLAAQSATASGVGTESEIYDGTGALFAQSATVVGAGIKAIGGVGTLLAQPAGVVGSGGITGAVFGTGVLQAQVVTVSGVGKRDLAGTGVLRSTDASASGLGTVITIAVDYVCYLPIANVQFEALPMNANYKLQFNNPRRRPVSKKVGWDHLVDKFTGVERDTEVAYKFSNDREFEEDQN